MFRLARITGAIALAAVLLSGCSLVPASLPLDDDSGQTVAQACAAILPVMIDAGQRVKAASEEFQENPSAAVGPVLHGISDDLHAAAVTVENGQVLDAVTRAIGSLDSMIAEIDEALAGDRDVLALLATANAARDDFSAVEQLCQNA